ncbi:E3 ubiquitin-protein ligase RNF26 [Seriola lalandi dorsalis]|uniref:E3 ubiquitin-protein ligase RNF26 n=1 Tax=Seriola lalandi dorsalis TaxID=1841481 RepID=UPI000C6F5422|nr:E3 ubiquitin-protein ligase RNF26 [Seriola lalandi dorsalis]XP_056231053.1 E3 ubiquitin-protein ligase RNF26 [Seriola aureovittata]
MGLVNVVISTIGKCLDAVCLLLDLNFLIVHTVVRTLLGVVAFINSLPNLLLASVLELGNLIVFCLVSMAEATSNVAHSTVTMLGSLVLALEGLLESLKMVGYLSIHVLFRGKEQLCRGLLLVLEGCGIAVSLVVYFTNTVVNFALIATQNVYLAVVSVWQTVSSPLQKVLELTLTSLTFLYSSLVGTSAFLWSPCKLVLDFLVSLVHMFISIFLLNIYGLLLTVTIAVTTMAYLNPAQTRQATVRIMDYISSFPALRRLLLALHHLASTLRSAPHVVHGNVQRLQRILHHLYLLERGLWQQLTRHSSQLGLVLRTHLHRYNNNRVRGHGDPGEERRGPPDGRAGDGAHQMEMLDLVFPSSSTDRPLKKQSSSGKDCKPLPAENLLTLLKEQEDRKKCVICQDCTKTVVLLPCRHLCLCRDCTDILLRQPIYQHNCPLCRHMILNTMDVYL